MDVFDAIKQDRPYTAYAFTATASSFNNIYGGNAAVTTSGSSITVGGATNTKIVAGNTSPINVGTDKLKIPFARMAPTYEKSAFSLEIWFRGFNPTGEVSLLSHNNAYDGLTYDGTNIYFKLKFGTAATAQITYLLPAWERIYHAIATFDGYKMTLYVNKIQVGQLLLTVAQQADVFATPSDAFLYSGQSTTSQKVIIDAPAIYHYALNAIQAGFHYDAGTTAIYSYDNVTKRNGLFWSLADDERNIGMERTLDWSTGVATKISVKGSLFPILDSTFTSVSGTWIGSVPINLTDDTSIAGVKLEWSGVGGFTVETSINAGGLWSAATNGQIATGTLNLDTTGLTLDIRITFTGGVLYDTAQVDSLYVAVYSDYGARIKNVQPRAMTLSGNVVTNTINEEINEGPDRIGGLFYGGTAVIGADASGDIKNIGTLEMWVKLNATIATVYTDGTNSFSYSAGTPAGSANQKYVNGVSTATASMPNTLGQWYHFVFTFTAHNNPITIGANGMQVGFIATYPQVMSGAEVADLYNNYFKVPELIADDGASYSVTLDEQSTAYTIYSYDWGRVGG